MSDDVAHHMFRGPEEYADTLRAAGLTKRNGAPDFEQAALFFGAHEATGAKWAQSGPPPAVVIGLRIMLAHRLRAWDIQKKLGRPWPMPFRAKQRRSTGRPPGRPRRAATSRPVDG